MAAAAPNKGALGKEAVAEEDSANSEVAGNNEL